MGERWAKKLAEMCDGGELTARDGHDPVDKELKFINFRMFRFHKQ